MMIQPCQVVNRSDKGRVWVSAARHYKTPAQAYRGWLTVLNFIRRLEVYSVGRAVHRIVVASGKNPYFHSQFLLVALPSGATSYSPTKPIQFRSIYFADAL
jgi:hypothetical protein